MSLYNILGILGFFNSLWDEEILEVSLIRF